MLQTRMTEILGTKYPIQCGTMHALTLADVVAKVANAGAFCCLPASFFEKKEDLLEEVKKVRDMTDQPFGCNVGLFPGFSPITPEELIGRVIEAGVKILETAGRSPEPYRKMITDAGLVHIHKCARVRDAVKVDKIGVDIVSIVGTECAGHPSLEEVGTIVLIPKAAESVKAPLIAGGGFCDGRGLIAALAFGAAGVNMGTRFMATSDFPIHDAFKQLMIDSDEKDTVLVMKSIMNPARVLRNAWAEKVLELEGRGATLQELAPLISGHVSREGWKSGKKDEGMYHGGQVVGRIHDKPTIAELVERIMAEAMEVKQRLSAL